MARKGSSTIGIKVLALLIAVLVWVYVFYQEGRVVDKTFENVPIIAQNIPQDMLLMDNLPTTTIRLKGSERILENVTKDNVTAYVDLMSHNAGSDQIKVQINYPNSESIKLNWIKHETISIDLQRMTSLDLDIKYEYTGEPPVGISFSEPLFEPEKVKVLSSPYNIVSTLSHALISINLTNMQPGENKTKLSYKLVTNTGEEIISSRWNSKKIKTEFEEISVAISGDMKINSAMLPARLKTSGNIPGDYIITSMDWNPKVVSVEGNYNTLENISYLQAKPLNLNGIRKNSTYTRPLIIPDGITLLDDSSKITVTIKVEKLETKFIRNIKIIVKPDNRMYDLSRQIIDFQIKGPASAIGKALGANAEIDITNLTKGVYTLPVTITGLPADVYLISPPVVEIELP